MKALSMNTTAIIPALLYRLAIVLKSLSLFCNGYSRLYLISLKVIYIYIKVIVILWSWWDTEWDIIFLVNFFNPVPLFSSKIVSALHPCQALKSNFTLAIWHEKTDLALWASWQEVTHTISKERGQTINPWRESYYLVTREGNNHNISIYEVQQRNLLLSQQTWNLLSRSMRICDQCSNFYHSDKSFIFI